jgi:hypothetical protein
MTCRVFAQPKRIGLMNIASHIHKKECDQKILLKQNKMNDSK